MKSERRHELQENALGSELARTWAFIKAKGNFIAAMVLVAALIVMVAVYVRGKGQQRITELQMQYERRNAVSLTPQEQVELLEVLAAQRDDNRIAALATVDLGDLYARRMISAGPTKDSAQWQESGERAGAYYQQVVASFPDERLALAKAHLGLARLAESRGELEAARGEYNTVLDMKDLTGQPVMLQAMRGEQQLNTLSETVKMATTAPAADEAEEPAPSE